MPNRGINGDIQRAKEYRVYAKTVTDPVAKQELLDAAERLERMAGRKARKVGRRRRKSPADRVRETR